MLTQILTLMRAQTVIYSRKKNPTQAHFEKAALILFDNYELNSLKDSIFSIEKKNLNFYVDKKILCLISIVTLLR